MANKILDDLSALFGTGAVITGTVSNVTADIKKDVQEVKDAAVVYGATSLALQGIMAAAAVVSAYAAWQMHKRKGR